MDTLLTEIREGMDYLNLQGKHINKIKMNADIFDNMTKLTNIEHANDAATLFGITIESDENIEKYAFILEDVN
ncbi:lactate dehydrogenase [Lysinibacillus sp. CD3-6]|uniref:lactate dehydrogenase n=1 Tax=Lysinibacillus sp. CD3-6 TaxID=2892541 RepID=UPI00116E473D|nr:lactate dehydrogenase [Lysinibacillus sp. CD3-6]UED78461.1 lactate dehydrogenase [Lysinibacillus sp. CD3-6]